MSYRDVPGILLVHTTLASADNKTVVLNLIWRSNVSCNPDQRIFFTTHWYQVWKGCMDAFFGSAKLHSTASHQVHHILTYTGRVLAGVF